MGELEGVSRDRLKLSFSKAEGEISRRQLFKLAIPRYEAVPFIEPALCRGGEECGLCLDACPLEAIKDESEGVIIDTSLCNGCGACVAACPFRAVVYPGYLPEEVDGEMEVTLGPAGPSPGPEMIALVCRGCLSIDGDDNGPRLVLPHGMVALGVPCLVMASPWLMLRAFDRGARGLALLCNREKCPLGSHSDGWQGGISFVQGLLGGWGVEPARIRVFQTDDDGYFAGGLEEFAREITGLGATRLKASEAVPLPDEGWLLAELVRGMSKKLGSLTEKVITAGTVPFGSLKLDGSKCTGCGLCVRDCPTEALTASSGQEAFSLLFSHDRCLGCNRCLAICPERCLSLEHILKLDEINGPAQVLFEDGIVRCRRCGGVIGSEAMVGGLRAKVLGSGKSSADYFDLCPDCKVRQLGLGIITAGPNKASG